MKRVCVGIGHKKLKNSDASSCRGKKIATLPSTNVNQDVRLCAIFFFWSLCALHRRWFQVNKRTKKTVRIKKTKPIEKRDSEEAKNLFERIHALRTEIAFKKELQEDSEKNASKLGQKISRTIKSYFNVFEKECNTIKSIQQNESKAKKEEINEILLNLCNPRATQVEDVILRTRMEILNRELNAQKEKNEKSEQELKQYRKTFFIASNRVLSEDEKTNKEWADSTKNLKTTLASDERELEEMETLYETLKRSEKDY